MPDPNDLTGEEVPGAVGSTGESAGEAPQTDDAEVLSRYQQIGFDLRSADPADVARAYTNRQILEKKYHYSEDEVTAEAARRVHLLLSNPQSREYIREKYYRDAAAGRVSPPAATGGPDPIEAKLKPILDELGGLREYVQRDRAERADRQQRAEADAQVASAEVELRSAIKDIAGASAIQRLERDFWTDCHINQRVPDKFGIRKFVMDQVRESRGQAPLRRRPTATRADAGSRMPSEVKADPNDEQAVMEELLDRFPEYRK